MRHMRLGGLRVRLLAVVLLGIVPTSALLYLQIANQRAALLAETRGEAERLTAAKSQDVAGIFETVRGTLLGISTAPGVRNHEVARANVICRGVLAKSPDLLNVSAVDAQGRVWASALPIVRPLDAAERQLFSVVRVTHAFTVGRYEVDLDTGKPSLVCAFPVLDARGVIGGIVTAHVNIQAFTRVIGPGSTLRGGAAVLIDDSGVVLARVPPLAGAIGKRFRDAAFVRIVLKEGSGSRSLKGLDGVTRVYAFTPVSTNSQTRLFLAIGFDEQQINAASRAAYQQALVALIAISALALGSAWLVAEFSVAQPARQLVDTARQLAKGNMAARSHLPRQSDEFGQLGTEFDAMAVAIGERLEELGRARDELTALNRELDRRVRERTAELEASNKELEAFSYSVSHDLRAPLRSIDGFSQALLEDHSSQLDTEGKDYLLRVRSAATRMGNLIDSLLSLSRLSRAPLENRPLELSSLAKVVVEELKAEQPDRRVEVSIDPDMEVQGDPALLQTLLENLIRNAWKFSGQREVAHVQVGSTQADGQTAFFVKDDGVGFDMAHADKLFGAFQRLHATDEFPGLGIGLATAYRVVRRHGGRMWAESEPGKGATFYFTIPAQAKAADATRS